MVRVQIDCIVPLEDGTHATLRLNLEDFVLDVANGELGMPASSSSFKASSQSPVETIAKSVEIKGLGISLRRSAMPHDVVTENRPFPSPPLSDRHMEKYIMYPTDLHILIAVNLNPAANSTWETHTKSSRPRSLAPAPSPPSTTNDALAESTILSGYSIHARVPDIQLELTYEHLNIIQQLLVTYRMVHKRKSYFHLRPCVTEDSPPLSARDWWTYAINAVIAELRDDKGKFRQSILRRLGQKKNKRLYIGYYRRHLENRIWEMARVKMDGVGESRSDGGGKGSVGGDDDMGRLRSRSSASFCDSVDYPAPSLDTPDGAVTSIQSSVSARAGRGLEDVERRDMSRIEALLPLEELLMYRRLVRLQLQKKGVDVARIRMVLAAEQRKRQRWLGRWFRQAAGDSGHPVAPEGAGTS